MTAKETHRINILSYLAVWENKWPRSDTAIAKLLGISRTALMKQFTPAEMAAIRNEGLELRKNNCATQRADIYTSMHKTGKKGNTTAQNSFLDRTEGKVADKVQLGFDDATLNIILSALPTEYAAAVKAQLAEIIKK